MITVERQVPSKIYVLDAIKRRANGNIETIEMIENLLRLAEIGYEGELKVDRLWSEISVPDNSILIHSYETKNDFGNSHQIDTLFVCPNYIVILEIKNLTGYIWYEKEKNQFLRRKKNGEVESFQSPIEQVIRHADFIERTVERLGLTVPIYKMVLIAEPSTVIGPVPTDPSIIHAVGLPSKIKELNIQYERRKALPKVHYELLSNHILDRLNPTIYKPRFEIPPLRKGALCLCGNNMKFDYGKFICSCGIKSRDPLYQGLHDYRFLYSEWITNSEFRSFFNIKNQALVSKVLARLNFQYKGSTKSRKYKIPKDILKRID
ncbi:nuclease-related domain-containing protein [Ureibacillus composti]